MNIIYFNNPVGSPRIQFLHSDETVEVLKGKHIIPMKASVLVKKFNPKMKSEEMLKLMNIDKTTFDDMQNPTKVIFDRELMELAVMEYHKKMRSLAFDILDKYQMRAFVSGNAELTKEIEKDKQALRDMTQTFNLSRIKTITGLYNTAPRPLTIDYEEKYKAKFK